MHMQVRKTALREVKLLREVGAVTGRLADVWRRLRQLPRGDTGVTDNPHPAPCTPTYLQLSHEHIVTLLDVFRQGGKLYLCFEYLEKTGEGDLGERSQLLLVSPSQCCC